MASAALASAGSVEEVATAVTDAAAALTAAQPANRTALLAVRDGDYLRYVHPAGSAEPAYPPTRSASGCGSRKGAPRGSSPSEEIRSARHGIASSAPQAAVPLLAGAEGALLCPLTLKDRPVGEPFIGLIGFFGDRRTLGDLATVLEILAGQAALAVERLALTQQVARQRGEALFRTLVQDASDVILIVGDDRRIRYATPSAADIFGDVTVEGALLADLVAPATRDDVDRVLDLMLALSASSARLPWRVTRLPAPDRAP